MTIVTWTGDPAGVLDHFPASFHRQASAQDMSAARLLINFTQNPEEAIEAATRLAASAAADHSRQDDRLVVTLVRRDNGGGWPQTRAAALAWAFTRHAALEWARRRIRVNAIGLGARPDQPWQTPEAAWLASGSAQAASDPGASDIAACIVAMWRWPSMTGQILRLGA